MQHFDYYLRGMKCTLHCDHKLLEPFLTKGMKILKLDRWAMLHQEYDITFVHIREKDNIHTETISRLHTIDIYEEAIENHHLPITQTTKQADNRRSNSSNTLFHHNPHSSSTWTPQHHVLYKNKISSVKIKYKNYIQA